MGVLIVALLVLSPISASDAEAEMSVSFYTSGEGEYGVTVTQITSADQLPEDLQGYYGENSVAVAFTLPSSNPIDSSSSEVVDFLITYHASSSASLQAYGAAVDSDGDTVLTLNERKYVIGSGETYLSEYMDSTYSAYNAFSFVDGTAYAVVNLADAGEYECSIALVTYTGNYANLVYASPVATFTTIAADVTTSSSSGTATVTVSAGSDGAVVTNSDDSVITVAASEGQTVSTSYSTTSSSSLPSNVSEIVGSNAVAFSLDVTVDGSSASSGTVTLSIPVSFTGSAAVLCYDDEGNIDTSAATVETSDGAALVTFKHFSNYVVYEAGSTITASSGAHGSISPSGTTTVGSDGTVTYTFTADEGYSVDTVTIDGEAVSVSGNTYSFAGDSGDHTIKVTYALGTSAGGDSGDGGTDYTIVLVIVVIVIIVLFAATYFIVRRN